LLAHFILIPRPHSSAFFCVNGQPTTAILGIIGTIAGTILGFSFKQEVK